MGILCGAEYIGDQKDYYDFPGPSHIVIHIEPCSICLEDYSYDQDLVVTKCRHTFHEACFQLWLAKSRTCPICRCPLGYK